MCSVSVSQAIAAFSGKGYLFNVQSAELFNLNFAREFMSQKGVSMLDQVRVTQQAKPRRFRRPRKLIAALTGGGQEALAGRLRQMLDSHAYLWRWLDALSQVVLTHLPQFLLADIGRYLGLLFECMYVCMNELHPSRPLRTR